MRLVPLNIINGGTFTPLVMLKRIVEEYIDHLAPFGYKESGRVDYIEGGERIFKECFSRWKGSKEEYLEVEEDGDGEWMKKETMVIDIE